MHALTPAPAVDRTQQAKEQHRAASALSAADGARRESITNGSNTIHAASATAICAVTESTWGPRNPSESITGNARAADEEDISTA
jgi:hypothetical protein